MNKTLEELSLSTYTFATIFAALDIADEVTTTVTSNISALCPVTTGIFSMKKVSASLAKCECIEYPTNRLYTGIYAPQITQEVSWVQAWTKPQEDYDDTPVESDVTRIKEALGDINYLDHYGKTLIEVLNKYTRQVLTDSSNVPNQILLVDYYGDIENISYNTPLLIQVANSSVEVTDAPTMTFEKEIWIPNPEWNELYPDLEPRYILEETITTSYPIKVIDLEGPSGAEYLDINATSFLKNVFYTFVRREALIEGELIPIFALLGESSAQEYNSLSSRLALIEAKFTDNLTTMTLSNITINTLATVAALNVSGNVTFGGTFALTGLGTFASRATFNQGITVTSGTTNSTIDTLTISGALNLTSTQVSVPSNPSAGQLITKSYVDTNIVSSINTAKADMIKGGTAVPTTGSAGSIYIQY